MHTARLQLYTAQPSSFARTINRLVVVTVLIVAAGFPSQALSVQTPANDAYSKEHLVSKQDIESFGLSELESLREKTTDQIEHLAEYSMRSGVGAVGFRALSYSTPDRTVWVKISMQETVEVDQVVLVPTIWRKAVTGFRADGFPIEFKILAGTDDDEVGQTVASFGEEDQLLPRVAPLVIEFATPVRCSWIKLEVSKLSRRTWDGRYDLQLSELLVFSGQENVALEQTVEASEDDAYESIKALDKRFLVDGFTPYLMDVFQGERSQAFVSTVGVGEHPELIMDLGQRYDVNRIHLHVTDTSDTVPQSFHTDYGVPRHFILEGADEPTFSNPTRLVEFRLEPELGPGPIIMKRFPSVECQYVKLTAIDPYIFKSDPLVGSQIGFAEWEIFSDGENVARGKQVTTNFELPPRGRPISSLTDGLNFYGKIIPIRQWLGQLNLRHDLEVQKDKIQTELNQRYAEQTTMMKWLTILVASLITIIVLVLIVGRWFRLRQLEKLKTQFAADLHDELGANLHTIGLLSDLAEQSQDPEASPNGELTRFLHRIRDLTERTGMAMKHVVNLQASDQLYTEFKSDMKRAAERIVVNLDHKLIIDGDEHIRKLKPRTRLDLFLFYKECLVNICRHSGATELLTHLNCAPDKIQLTIKDNGRGLEAQALSGVPPSLLRRARLLGATINVDCPESGGTCIELFLNTNQWGRRK